MGITFGIDDVVVTKKKHACGGNRWRVIRVGADFKIRCEICGRTIMLTPDELKKMVKYVESERE